MKAEKIASLAFTALAIAYLVGAFFIKEPPLRQQLGPEAFPKAIGVLMLFFALLYVRAEFMKQPAKEDEARAAIIGANEKLNANYVDYKTIGIMLALMLAYGLTFELLGYPVATLLMFSAGIFVLERKHWKRDLVIALLASFGIFFLFRLVLRVNLPAGILAFIFR